ncbi:macro domain-containing protein [Sulfurovum sp. NBC37-1]|uniref:macro domain-containing protein n=1 Tax=Sulfurovum sp. (strain NBC37-1) TaxID=387093 RepID=UPI00015879BA|nr:macro domain-containing protein [Sulfurovum sp. NBC37-1]BAF73251.1 conserved hypothetical protein [Sulfurovum sp. NBC37-1]
MGYKITVKQGNLLEEENATFIVNASNTRLILGSGVSMSFKRHCGHELQEEMGFKLDAIGEELRKGDIVATSSANAKNFRYALHVAIMDYNKGTKECNKYPALNDIEIALENIEPYLEWYAKEHTEPMKLVLPLLGCGTGGLDVCKVSNLYKSFLSRDVSFDCNVVIYGYSEKDYELIKSFMIPSS